MSDISRRAFLTRAGALALGFSFPLFSGKAQDSQSSLKFKNSTDDDNRKSSLEYHNAYIEITPSNEVVFRIPDIELGQGIYTAAAMLLAEELEVELSAVKVRPALPSPEYILKGELTEITWGSGSTQKDWFPLQQAAATLRIMLIESAAQFWRINPDQCYTQKGQIYGPDNRQSPYSQFLVPADKLSIPKDIILKKKEAYSLIGKSQPRVDTPSKINGKAIFAADISLPAIKTGYMIACPVVGGKLVRIHDQQARQVQGVVDILSLEDMVCIIAEHFWAASKAAKLLKIEWDFGPNGMTSTDSIYKQLIQASDQKGIVGYSNSSVKIETALAATSHVYKMTYRQPMLAHAALEALSCTIEINDNHCEIWSCSQTPLRTQDRIAELLKRDKKDIIFHNVYVGGSFGRRLDEDYILQAVKFAQKISYPLKCVWSREEDFLQDHVRPPYLDQIEVGVGADGLLTTVKHNLVGPSIMARWDKSQLTKEGMDPDLFLGINTIPYEIPHYQLNYTRCDIDAIIPGWWQGNGATRNVFVIESIINKCAVKAKKDVIEYRKQLKVDARATAVMDLVAQHAQWDQPLSKDIGRGFALAHVFNSYIAMVVEAEVTAMSVVRLHRVIVAVDCGLAVNPDQIAAQIESSAIIGLGSALYNEVQLEQGKIVQRNFNQYRILHMNEAPQIEVHIIKSDEAPSGVGELGTIVAAPALAHALGSILNKQLYSLPLNKYLL
ncbi:xanthine dehydrogenase family protein molybdopterin-binding subunit [Commensalibacter papalotli (ex Botero et al. 2024)]|uniref:xanthine dehydrogenase family protein molybdopterin-binding subunit n=1 Tax=Commensalibacter papalotli (ex Botero et al. 2024) TaxID=2972766 RepID=UPI0022FFBF88|nr:molybdopterin cofactor-binding domain-containing protein [Commensalibacter papalotli (ex Botero et al. 2024)]CAI3931338.1 Aldehyde [Commensalibacter papalotli (ex Botero et al. 2024)]